MDRGIHLLLLSALALAVAGTAPAARALDAANGSDATPQVVEPRVKRRDVEPVALDTENFEAGAYIGSLSIEDFGSSVVYGARFAYHFSEDLYTEATIGTAKAGTTSYEDLSGAAQLLSDDERQFTSYDLSLGWNALPGEVFLAGRAMPHAVYFALGAGSTRFGGDDHFTVSLGTGLRLLATDWIALHLDARDLAFESDLLGKNKLTHNLQFSLGLTAFF
jgi:outer membrane beta-barrel protein